MQDKVDFLSEQRLLDYMDWKEDIMSKMEQLEDAEAGGQSRMDTAEG
jgi:hypothetical protein